MNLRHSLANTFNVHPGEGWTTILLTGFSFLIGIFMSYFISLANAFYLGDFGAEYLPQGYLVTGVVGYLSGILLARLQRRFSYKKLIFTLVVLPLILTCLFRIGLWQTSSKWLSFAMFVSVGPFVTFIYFALFSLMGRLFNLRQGKRLFGLVNSGDVVSSIMGFFSLPFFLLFFENTANLLWIAGGGLGLCVVVLNEVFRRFPDQLVVTHTGQEERSSSRFLDLVKQRYFVLMFLLLMATVVGFYYADYILLASLDIRFKANKTLLAQFIAIIYGLIKLVELVAKMLSGRLISQYGIGFGLMALPVLLCFFTSLGAGAGTVLGNESSIFFLFIVASKLIERVVTRSLFEPAFNVLYQPLDAELRLDVQTKVEMIIQPITVGLTGATLLIFNWFGALTLVVGVLGVVAFAWSFGSYLLYREYRQFLLQNLTQKLDQTATASHDDISSVDLLMGKLQDGDARGVISAYRLLKQISPASIGRLLRELLTHPEPEVRQMALEDVGQMGHVGLLEDVERQVGVEKEQQVRETALETLERLRQLGEVEAEHLTELAYSSSSSDRTLAAMLLGNSEQALPVLPELLGDDHREVRKAALLAAGKTRQTDLWEKMVDHLTPPAFSNAATSALTLVGEPVLPVLEAAFSPQSRSPLALLRIAWIYGAVGGEKAIAWLADRINYSDFRIRRQVLRSLLRCGCQAKNGQSTAVNREIEEALDNALWCMAALLDVADEGRLGQLKAMLGGEIDRNREQVFRLLSLAYDARHIMLVRDSFKSGSADAKVYALELVDMFIDSELKISLMPILDDLTLAQRLKLLELKFPQQRLAIVSRLKDIINRPYSRVERWTKAGALRALADVGDRVEDELIATLFHPDGLLSETAAWSLYRIDPAAYDRHVARLSEAIREGLDQVIKASSKGSVNLRLIMDKVGYLKGVEAFAAIPEADLIDLAEHVKEIQVQADQVVFEGGDLAHQVYILVEGQVRLHTGDRTLGHWPEKEMMGGPMTQTDEKSAATATVVERARFLVVDQDDLYNLIADRVEVASSVFNALNPPPS